MIIKVLLKTAVIYTCGFKHHRYCFSLCLFFELLNTVAQIRKSFIGVVQHLRLTEWFAFFNKRLVVAGAFGDIHRHD